MEDCKKKKLGAGILTVSIIQLVCYILGILSFTLSLLILNTDILPTEFSEGFMAATNGTIPNFYLYINLIFYIIFTTALILILFKKALGVYLYFLAVIVNYIYLLIMNGFYLFSLVGLILPILMAIFIYRRRAVFNIGTKCANA